MIERGLQVVGMVLLVLGGACGESGSFRDRVFDNGTVRYRVGSLARGFRPVDVADNDLAWHHPNYGTISVNSTCTEYEDVPARALMNQLLMGTTNRNYRVDETVTLDGRAAKHILADLELDGVPITIDVYLIVKDGCVYDLTHVSGRAYAAKARPLFRRFVRNFAVLKTRKSPEQAQMDARARRQPPSGPASSQPVHGHADSHPLSGLPSQL